MSNGAVFNIFSIYNIKQKKFYLLPLIIHNFGYFEDLVIIGIDCTVDDKQHTHTHTQITTTTPHHSVFCRPDALPAAQPTASEH